MISFGERSNGSTFLSQKNQPGCLETTRIAPMALPSVPDTAGVLRGTPRWWTLSQHSISHQHPHTLVRRLKQRPYGKNEVCRHLTHPHFSSGGGGNLKTNNADGLSFLEQIGDRLSSVTGEPRESSFLSQRLSVLVQHFNMVAFRDSFISETGNDFSHSRLDLFLVFNSLNPY